MIIFNPFLTVQFKIASIEERLAPLKKEIIELNSQISELTSNSSENSAVLQLRAAIDAQIEITKR